MLKLLILVLAGSLVNGEVNKVTPLITGGSDTVWGEYPAAVAIEGPVELCGGTVIHPNHVITAASCVVNDVYEVINPRWFNIFGGDIFFTPASRRRQNRLVTQIFVHPNFNPFSGDNNVAILRLNSAFTLPSNTIDIAVRANRIVPVGQNCRLVAFGSAAPTGSIRVRQAAVQQPILNRDTCITTDIGNRMTEQMICARSDRNMAPCTGNLGSGLYCNGIFTGILTNGLTCGAGITFYHQIRAYATWISQTFALPQGNQPGTLPFDARGLPYSRRT